MELSEVHFKPNLHIFPYLETEVIFFSQKHTYLHFGTFKEPTFLNNFFYKICSEKLALFKYICQNIGMFLEKKINE
jgi:hypothetical protein